MNKEDIEKAISEMTEYVPVKKIEQKLGMPKTTLQKVLKGERELPKKWIKPLEAFFGLKYISGKKETPKEGTISTGRNNPKLSDFLKNKRGF